jgi:hypothetical protein
MRTKTDPSKPTEERTVAFASVILALSLFGFLWPHHNAAPKQHSATNLNAQDSHKNSLPKISLPRAADPGWGPVSF